MSDDIFLSKEVMCLKKIKYKNSTINIVGEADIEKIKQATIIFLKKVQRSNKHVECKTRVIDKK